MANWNQPTLTDTYANFLAFLDARLDDLAYGLDPAITTVTNPPTNSIRWNSASNRWEKFVSGSWGALSSLYAINISGNAATASTLATSRNINGVAFNGSANITITANTSQALTFNNGGTGAASGTTFDGGTARTISYNSVGAPSTTGTNASGTWGINITGNAATASTAAAVNTTSTITSTARVGMRITTSSNDAMYEVVKTGVVGYALTITADNRITLSQTNGQGDWFKTLLAVDTDGNTVTAGNLNVTGDMTANGNVTAYSDERLKEGWRDLSPTFLAELAEVKMGVYNRKDTGITQVGVGAQSLQRILPWAVAEGADGMLSVAYGNAALASCVALAREVMSLKAEIAALKG